jgi:hypothetical protein
MDRKQKSLKHLAVKAKLYLPLYERLKANLKGYKLKADKKALLTGAYHSSKLAKAAKNRARLSQSNKLHSKINLSLHKELTKGKDKRDKSHKREAYILYFKPF